MRLSRGSHIDGSENGQELYEGAGVIRQGADQTLEFVFYARESLPRSQLHDRDGQAGQLIPDSAFYTLEATDASDRRWVATRVLPRPTRHLQVPGTMFDGGLGEIRCAGEHESPSAENQAAAKRFTRDEIVLHAFQPVHAPPNAKTRTVVEGPLGRSENNRLDAVEMEVFDGRGVMHVRDDHAICTLRADPGVFPPNAALRVREALQFALGHRVRWSLVCERRGRAVSITVSGEHREEDTRDARPPVAGLGVPPAHTWRLFSLYLKYAAARESDGPHPLTLEYDAVLRARGQSLATQALVLGVAVTAIVEITQRARPVAELDELKVWATRIATFLETSDCPKNLVDRFRGLHGMLGEPRPHDTLYELAKSGAVEKELVATWKSLRNLAAHAAWDPEQDLQGAFSALDKTLVLVHQLVLHAVGYVGPFRNYAEPDWPMADYPQLRAP